MQRVYVIKGKFYANLLNNLQRSVGKDSMWTYKKEGESEWVAIGKPVTE